MTDTATVQDGDDAVAAEAESIKTAASEARSKYEKVMGIYEDYAKSIESVLANCIAAERVMAHSITSRAKHPESFERKAAQPSSANPLVAKYDDPMDQITDKSGVRIITYFLSAVSRVSEIIQDQFEVLEAETKASSEPDRFGYQSDHYLVRFSSTRDALPEYSRFAGLVAEIQVRTILQHAWAEIEHDIQYKAVATLPHSVRRRFGALAGLIEIADREFQAIEDEDQAIRRETRRKVDLGQLDQVEITGDSLRAYLDKKYGPDGRMADFSYRWTARLLLRLGFTNLAQVDDCIRGYNDDQISRLAFGSRQGQLNRFEGVLLASMGEGLIVAHLWADPENSHLSNWYINYALRILSKLRNGGIVIGDYRPPEYPADTDLPLGDLEAAKSEIAQGSAALPPSS
jgi:ppGpp synthetase/RelA/SpoT-type nucleotidyltranferase